MSTRLCMIFFLILTFLSQSAASPWRKVPYPFEPGNLAERGQEQDKTNVSLTEVGGEMNGIRKDVGSLTKWANKAEEEFEDLVDIIQKLANGSEKPKAAANPSASGQGNNAAVRALLQQLESRLKGEN